MSGSTSESEGKISPSRLDEGNNDDKGGTAHSVRSRILTTEEANKLRAGLTEKVENGTQGDGIIAQSLIALLSLQD